MPAINYIAMILGSAAERLDDFLQDVGSHKFQTLTAQEVKSAERFYPPSLTKNQPIVTSETRFIGIYHKDRHYRLTQFGTDNRQNPPAPIYALALRETLDGDDTLLLSADEIKKGKRIAEKYGTLGSAPLFWQVYSNNIQQPAARVETSSIASSSLSLPSIISGIKAKTSDIFISRPDLNITRHSWYHKTTIDLYNNKKITLETPPYLLPRYDFIATGISSHAKEVNWEIYNKLKQHIADHPLMENGEKDDIINLIIDQYEKRLETFKKHHGSELPEKPPISVYIRSHETNHINKEIKKYTGKNIIYETSKEGVFVSGKAYDIGRLLLAGTTDTKFHDEIHNPPVESFNTFGRPYYYKESERDVSQRYKDANLLALFTPELLSENLVTFTWRAEAASAAEHLFPNYHRFSMLDLNKFSLDNISNQYWESFNKKRTITYKAYRFHNLYLRERAPHISEDLPPAYLPPAPIYIAPPQLPKGFMPSLIGRINHFVSPAASEEGSAHHVTEVYLASRLHDSKHSGVQITSTGQRDPLALPLFDVEFPKPVQGKTKHEAVSFLKFFNEKKYNDPKYLTELEDKQNAKALQTLRLANATERKAMKYIKEEEGDHHYQDIETLETIKLTPDPAALTKRKERAGINAQPKPERDPKGKKPEYLMQPRIAKQEEQASPSKKPTQAPIIVSLPQENEFVPPAAKIDMPTPLVLEGPFAIPMGAESSSNSTGGRSITPPASATPDSSIQQENHSAQIAWKGWQPYETSVKDVTEEYMHTVAGARIRDNNVDPFENQLYNIPINERSPNEDGPKLEGVRIFEIDEKIYYAILEKSKEESIDKINFSYSLIPFGERGSPSVGEVEFSLPKPMASTS